MKTITKEDIKKGLSEFGLKKGDIVILHSSLASLGRVEGGADTVIDAFLDTIEEEGTLVVPTFGALGIITDKVKERENSVKSIHPFASVAAIGKDAEKICEGHWKSDIAHAEDTPYVRIAEMGGYICLMGVDQDRNTTLHTVEELIRSPYLKPTQERTFDTPGGEVTKKWDFFPGPHRDFIALDSILRESGKMKTGKIGNSAVRLIKSKDLIDICVGVGQEYPDFVLCDNPNCADCVSQRADLNRDLFSKEDFSLAVSASLAGRYVPEMIENMKNCGIDNIEIDCIQGKPVEVIKQDCLKKAVNEFRESGINVISVRFNSVPGSLDEALEKTAACGVERIVMPLTAAAAEHIAGAEAKNIKISFFNSATGSIGSSDILLKLGKDAKAGFTFNAVNFARCGEHPFLGSYKKKLRRFIDQLDVEDALFDGTPEALACGNAEIKEMISILRCSSFPGHMVLGAGNRSTGNLADAVEDFKELLYNM